MLEEWSGTEKKQYCYDPLNRQQDVSKADGIFQTNRYDAEGLRAEMEENGRLCRFIFHQGEIVAEERDGVAAVSRYLRGYGVEYLEQENKRFSFQKDEQSSTVFLLDRNYEVQGYYAYDGFGNLRNQQGSVENRILYTGQQYDGMAEQYYLRARYYNPVIGRFIQEDPYRGDGLNLYAYCANNPVRYFDPSGYSGGLNCPGVGFEGSGKIDPTKYNMISNKYPNEALPLDGKIIGYTIVDGKIKVDNGTRYFDFVIDKNGNLIIGSHHHYLGNADDVIAAGQIKLNGKGKLMSIDNGSGHYKPTAADLEIYPTLFNELGIDTGGTWVKTIDESGIFTKDIYQLGWD